MRIVFLMLIVTICDLGNCAFSQSKYPTAEIEPLYDLNFTRAERDSLLSGLQDYQKAFQALQKVSISNTVPI